MHQSRGCGLTHVVQLCGQYALPMRAGDRVLSDSVGARPPWLHSGISAVPHQPSGRRSDHPDKGEMLSF